MSEQRARRSIATSRYRQVRLTCTQEVNGRVTYSVWVKPIKGNWNEGHCVVRDQVDKHPTLDSLEDVYGLLIRLLAEQCLPRSHGD